MAGEFTMDFGAPDDSEIETNLANGPRVRERVDPQRDEAVFEEQAEEAQVGRSEQQAEASQKGETNIFESTFKAWGIGAVDGVNEINKFTGFSDGLKEHFGVDIAFGGKTGTLLPDPQHDMGLVPENTYEAFVATISQFTGPFGSLGLAGKAAVKIVPKLSKLGKIMDKSPKLKALTNASLKGAIVDAAAFDPNDPNIGNYLLTLTYISESPRATSLIKDYLATDPNDSAALNRSKNALSGVLAGIIAERVFAGIGNVFKKVKKGGDQVSEAEVKAAAQEQADKMVEAFETTKKSGDPDAVKKLVETIPEPNPALPKELSERNYHDQLKKVTPDQIQHAKELIKKLQKGEKIDITDEMLPFNLNKVKAPEDVISTIHVIGQALEGSLPRNLSVAERLAEGAKLHGVDVESYTAHVQKNTNSVQEAIQFIEGSKASAAFHSQKTIDLARKFEANPTPENELAFSTQLVEASEAARAASGLGTAFGQGLATFKKVANLKDIQGEADLLRTDLMNRAVNPSKDTAIVRARHMTKLNDLNEAQHKHLLEQLKREEKLFKGKDKAQVTKDLLEADLGQLRGYHNYVNKGFLVKTRDALSDIFINGLLSNPKTQIINTLGNTSSIMLSIVERAIAAIKNRGSTAGVTGTETLRLMYGYRKALKDTFKVFTKAWNEGATSHSKTDMARPYSSSLSKENFNMSGGAGRFVDFLSKTVDLPGKLLLSVDQVFQHVNTNGQRYALAHRKALRKFGKHPETVQERAAFNNISAEMLDDADILAQSKEFSRTNTFTNDLPDRAVVDPKTGKTIKIPGITKSIQNALKADPTGFTRTQIPFFKTPANLLRFSGQRLPGARRFSQELTADLASNDAAVRQLAEAKTVAGISIMSITGGLAWDGLITGGPPADFKLRQRMEETGWKPYSFYNPTTGKYTEYNRLDPIGTLMAISANLAILGKSFVNLSGHQAKHGMTPELEARYNDLLADGIFTMARVVSDRHYLQGVGNMVDFLTGDPAAAKRVGESLALFANPTASFYSSLRKASKKGLAQERQATDLHPREPLPEQAGAVDVLLRDMVSIGNALADETLKGIPGYDNDVGPKLDLVGGVTYYPGADANTPMWESVTNALTNPFASPAVNRHPVLMKIAELDISLEGADDIEVIEGVEITNEERNFMGEQWGKLNREQLTPLIKTKQFLDLSEVMQADLMKSLLLGNRDIAKAMTLGKFERIVERISHNIPREVAIEQQGNPLNNIQGLFTPNN